MNRRILRIAIPAIVSNITVPLLGLIDLGIVGHLGAPAYIGAIAIGSMIFNLMYWLFAFVRMGTSGITSQAFGRRDLAEDARILARSMWISGVIALALLLLQHPIRELAFLLMRPDVNIRPLAITYFNICIWGAPAVLGLSSLSGWYVGMQNSRIPMLVAIAQNVVNIIVSLLLVFALGMKVEGVAWGTVIAQWCGFLVNLLLCTKYYGKVIRKLYISSQNDQQTQKQRSTLLASRSTPLASRPSLHASRSTLSHRWEGLMAALRAEGWVRPFFKVNVHIFIRTLFMVSVNVFFTSAGSWQGEMTLAVNSLLLQFLLLFSYFMDGFAYAGEALCGKYLGAHHRALFVRAVRQLLLWGLLNVAFFIFVYGFFAEPLLGLLTNQSSVIAASRPYQAWLMVVPVVGMLAFLWDGIYIGTTSTRLMLESAIVATCVYFFVYFCFHSSWGNHALWLAYSLFLLSRSAYQTVRYPRVLMKV